MNSYLFCVFFFVCIQFSVLFSNHTISIVNNGDQLFSCCSFRQSPGKIVSTMAAYPGEGYNMSNYGLKTYTPEQMKEQWREKVERESKVTKYHPASKNTKHHVEQLCTSQQLNYFNTDKKYESSSTYDRMFHVKEGYSSKLKRDDLQHTQGLNVHVEEEGKSVPVLSSSDYGHRPPLETPDRQHVRVGLVKRDFYRSCGTNMNPSGSA